ncbi:hypothetical protein JCM8208_007825 [Rhodotorula glutinis]
MPPKLPSLQRIHDTTVRRGIDRLKPKDLRRLLREDEGFECSDAEWDGALKAAAVAQWMELQSARRDVDNESPPPAKKVKTAKKVRETSDEDEPAPKDKYDRAAERNLGIFLTADDVVGGMFGAGAGDLGEVVLSDDTDESPSEGSAAPSASPEPPKKRRRKPSATSSDGGAEAESLSASGSGSRSPVPSTTKGKGKKRDSTTSSTSKANKKGGDKKPRTKAPKGGFKSAEFIADSDDSSHEVPARDGDGDGGGEEAPKKGRGKARAKGAGEGKGKKKERKAPEPKEGDAPRGTEHEEDRIKKLKDLLAAASGPRAFTAATGAERTLTVERRTEVLEDHLQALGLAVKSGRLPSLSKAKEVGKKRLLAKEMQELAGNPSKTGLRDGKRVHADSSDDDGGDSDSDEGPTKSKPVGEKARIREVVEQRKAFASFLGDQSSDSD